MVSNNAHSLSTLLPPWRYCFLVLYAADWPHVRFLGSYYAQPNGTCCYVLVLLPERTGHSHLVEGMDYSSPNPPVCY